MRKMTVCGLIQFSPDAHEVGTAPAETIRRMKCQELGLTQADIYQAGGEGLRPEAKLLICHDKMYHGERELEYHGERWEVIRSDPYKEWNGVILSIRRKKGNARSPAVTAAPAAGQEAGNGDE